MVFITLYVHGQNNIITTNPSSVERSFPSVKGLLDYAIKIAATWVACKKLHARIARTFTLRIQHRAIFFKVFGLFISNL